MSKKTKQFDIEAEIKRLKLLKLTQEEIDEIVKTYLELTDKGKREWKLIRDIVPIEEWINDEYYLGREVHDIYPYWKERIVEIFSREDRPTRVIITGSIGTGKTYMSALIIIRMIYELSCYENVANLYKLAGITRIAFVYLSVTKDQAENSGYSFLKDWIDQIPYFQEEFPRRAIDSQLIFPQENLLVTFGSATNHFIGMSVIASVLDEANFFEGRQVDDANMKMNTKVSALHSQLMARSSSRFIVGGKNYSMSILVSSSTSESSYTEEQIEASKNDPLTVVYRPTQWEVKDVGTYCGKKFLVYIGGDGFDPFVIQDFNDLNLILEVNNYAPISGTDPALVHEALPFEVQSKLLPVPIEFKRDFDSNVIIALQDIAGHSVSSSSKFFSNTQSYEKSIDANLEHPFTQENIVLSTTDSIYQEGYRPVQHYIKEGFKFKNPKAPRYMHLDLALTNDSVGISMAHIDGYIEADDRYEEYSVYENTTSTKGIKVPKITVDFMLEIKPPQKPNKISLSKIRDFIVYLNKVMGIRFALISTDQFQSEHLRQELDELGYNTSLLSVDRNVEAYSALSNLMYEGRLAMYDYAMFKQELFNLILYPEKKKIDHPNKGCFVGHQKVSLLDGTEVEIQDLIGRDDFWVYSALPDGTIMPGKGYHARETKRVKETVKITLDNDEVIESTYEHPFMLRDGTYLEAQYLTVGTSLMPLYKRETAQRTRTSNSNYVQVKDNKTGRWNWGHRLVVRRLGHKLSKDDVVHHKDFNPMNNNPENLEPMTRIAHNSLHAKLSKLGSKPENVAKRVRTLKRNKRIADGLHPDSEYTLKQLQEIEEREIRRAHPDFGKMLNMPEESRAIWREQGRKLNEDWWNSEEGLQRKAELQESREKQLAINLAERIDRLNREWIAKFDKERTYRNITEVCKIYGGGRQQNLKRMQMAGYDKPFTGSGKWKVLPLEDYNHKVKSVEFITYEEEIPVYDISVEGTSNFALTAGVIVHNSKDVADSVAGSVFSALKSLDKSNQTAEDVMFAFVNANQGNAEQALEQAKENIMRELGFLQNKPEVDEYGWL